jgi:hypothetical protein
MQRGFVLALAAALCACAPSPVQMPAAQAAEVLNLFAAGRGPADICSPDGRAVLRGAVRAYGREMQEAGVAWPAIPGVHGEAQNVTAVDVSVMVAFAAGFVKTGDFQQPARRFMTGLTFAQWPEIQSMRMAAREACDDVAKLQQAAARVVIEQTRLANMVRSAERNNRGVETVNRLRRQSAMLDRAKARMEEQAAIVQARMDAHGL